MQERRPPPLALAFCSTPELTDFSSALYTLALALMLAGIESRSHARPGAVNEARN